MSALKNSYPRRTLLFFLRGFIIILLIIFVAIIFFFAASHMSNIDILVREGMKARAQVIYHEDDADEIDLTKYFSQECIDQDTELKNDAYSNFTITGYNQKVDFSPVIVFPWQREKEIYVTDVMVNIRGSVISSSEDASVSDEIPEWKNGMYRIKLERDGSYFSLNSRWIITSMEFVTEVEVSPIPTPNASSEIRPAITPSPTMTVEPTPAS